MKTLLPLKEEQILEGWDNDSPCLVSIICIAYNHADFISDAINSFLAQKCQYKYEIIIHDDASNDGSQDIILNFQKKYPKIIKSILQKENQYSKGIKPFDILLQKAKGKYIAVCEGDDFWCDPFKIQKQVDFLEQNPDYIVSAHNACIVNEKNEIIKESRLYENQKRDFTQIELITNNCFILTLTWVFRNINFNDLNEKSHVLNEDTFFTSVLGLYGKAKYHDDIIPAAYRIHSGGVWSSIDEEKKLDALVNTNFWLYIYHKRIKSGWESYYKKQHLKLTLSLFTRKKGNKRVLFLILFKAMINKIKNRMIKS
ncbi:glycosyltransferase [Providencia stuartii]|uniref:glycosyltransferase n=1 Tax=Providencia stuartii TaxID=588 RepID=UPI0004F73D58|nr:glycosyltransferase [Providencia stuartii]AIN62429.1 glycosyl transferase 2 family protein [Providencia stuartii]MBK1419158.1 glycosyltransferase [Providencia stuartii]QQC53225.1 glycosyltransferase [Providencia stuartii]